MNRSDVQHPRHRYRDSHYPWVEGYPTTSDDDALKYLYGNIPEEKWLKEVWLKKLQEVIDQYEPDIIWFDSWLDRIPLEYRMEFAAYYLNHAREQGKEVVITRKQDDLPLSYSIDDYEKGRMDRLTEKPWLTDDTISLGSWSYTRDLGIKSSERVLHDFVDIVSKNGQLLLNISPRADGSIPDNQRAVLLDLGTWLERNGEAIYETRPWRVFGEGPTRLSSGGGFVKAVEYTAADIRFTTRGEDVLYVTSLGRPQGQLTVQSLSTNLSLYEGEIGDVSLVGSDDQVSWERDETGLNIEMPQTVPEQLAYVWRVVKKVDQE
jgi:alpha-L-fucosidase